MLEDLKQYLEQTIVPTFKQLIEDGHIKYDLKDGNLIASSENTTVQLGRYLWFFSNYYQYQPSQSIKAICDSLYTNLTTNYKQKAGFIISSENSQYNVYFNSFVLYGLSEYYKITNDQKVLTEIITLDDFIERNFYKPQLNMYHEQLDNQLVMVSNTAIDYRENGYTANSLIHLLEAYTNVVTATNLMKDKLERIIKILFTSFYDNAGFFVPYVDADLTPDYSYVSYGHDIETIWLVIEAINQLQIDIHKYAPKLTNVYRTIVEYGLERDGFIKVQSDKQISTWWGQVEAIVGFMYCERELGLTNDYYKSVYRFTVNNYMTENGLFSEINNNREVSSKTQASIWKTPYHDGRMLLKTIKILEEKVDGIK